MKRYLLYGLILAATLVMPVKRTDVGKLQPIQTVAVYLTDRGYSVQTDTGDIGVGETVSIAIENLERTTAGVAYLDTAEFLLVSEGEESVVEELKAVLKNSVKLYWVQGQPDLKSASRFLSVHVKGPTFKSWEKGVKLPLLVYKNDRMILQ